VARGAHHGRILLARTALNLIVIEESNVMGKKHLQGVTVLVVDDDADARNVLRQMVVWLGATVHTAPGGVEALAWLETHTPDLLLLDLRMPGPDGVTVLECLRAQDRFRKLRAIAVTALGSDADVMRTWEAGFDGHLVKPVDLETLAAALNRAFWAHSGEVRFAVSHAATRTTGRPRTRALRIVDAKRRRAS
jgi:CheY-like chemotaxis protein